MQICATFPFQGSGVMKYPLFRVSSVVFVLLGLSLPALPAQKTIVIGFVGGFVKHSNSVHSEVQQAFSH